MICFSDLSWLYFFKQRTLVQTESQQPPLSAGIQSRPCLEKNKYFFFPLSQCFFSDCCFVSVRKGTISNVSNPFPHRLLKTSAAVLLLKVGFFQISLSSCVSHQLQSSSAEDAYLCWDVPGSLQQPLTLSITDFSVLI